MQKKEKLNVKDAEQSFSTEPSNSETIAEKKPLMVIVAEIMQHFVKEDLEPKEILMVLREVESEAMVALIAERLAEYDGGKN